MKTIKLPAPIGAKVYLALFGRIREYSITGYYIDADGVKEVYYKSAEEPHSGGIAKLEIVDFTREDAEKRLAGEVEV